MTGPRRLDRIKILEYDAEWPDLFHRERARLEPVLADQLVTPIEHIGSTSVPGLPAKPIIDMAAEIRAYAQAETAFAALAHLGWLHAPEPGDPENRKWSLCFPSIEHRTHHLHLFEHGTGNLRSLLAFRDHLRSHRADRDEYGRIKQELAATNDEDRPRYRAGKAPYITDILRRIGE